jgi:hypothetical protein
MGRLGFGTIIHQKNIEYRFKAIGIWPFNYKVMDTKNQLSNIYITASINNQGNEDNYTIHEKKVNHN